MVVVSRMPKAKVGPTDHQITYPNLFDLVEIDRACPSYFSFCELVTGQFRFHISRFSIISPTGIETI